MIVAFLQIAGCTAIALRTLHHYYGLIRLFVLDRSDFLRSTCFTSQKNETVLFHSGVIALLVVSGL